MIFAGRLHVVLGAVVDVHTNYQELLSLLVALRVRIAKLRQKLFSRGTAEGLHIGRCWQEADFFFFCTHLGVGL